MYKYMEKTYWYKNKRYTYNKRNRYLLELINNIDMNNVNFTKIGGSKYSNNTAIIFNKGNLAAYYQILDKLMI